MNKQEKIGSWSLEDWTKLARRDDCFNWMVPSDIRCLAGELSRLRTALEKIAENDVDGLEMLTPQAMQYIARKALEKGK